MPLFFKPHKQELIKLILMKKNTSNIKPDIKIIIQPHIKPKLDAPNYLIILCGICFNLFTAVYCNTTHAQSAGLPTQAPLSPPPPPMGFGQNRNANMTPMPPMSAAPKGGDVVERAAMLRAAQNNAGNAYANNYGNNYGKNQFSGSGMTGSAPPRSGLGQTVNVIATPRVMPPVHKKVERIFNEFQRAQLTPKQMQHVKKMNLNQQEVLSSPYTSTPKPVTRTLMLNLSPGVSAPVLRLSAGALTSVVFSGNNGDPWYIEQVKLNRNFFSDGMSGGNAGGGSGGGSPTNVLTLEPLRSVVQGNVSIMLKGLSTPVIFSLSTSQAEVDFRVDAKVPGRNPDSTTQISYEERLPSLDDNVPYFLDGVPPKGAKRLKVSGGGATTAGGSSGGDVEAWRLNNSMYIRTNADVQYPAYHSSARSTSGLAVYRFEQAYHAITLLQGGRAYTVQIEGQD
jgi:intracellular multiplication protein IcmK